MGLLPGRGPGAFSRASTWTHDFPRQVQACGGNDGNGRSEAYSEIGSKPSLGRGHRKERFPLEDRAGQADARLCRASARGSGGGARSVPQRAKTQPSCEGCGGPVSRVLSWGVIPLGWMSPSTSCDLPAGSIGSILAACAVRRLIWSCSLGGLPCPSCCQSGGGLLPHRFTLACSAPCFHWPVIGGLFSVALSVGSPRPGVTRPSTLRSPDFPLPLRTATP